MKQTGPILSGQLKLILAISLVYILAWFAYYSRQPVGIYPGPEATHFLEAALTMAQGSATTDSSYSLYTYILSILARFSVDEASLTTAARGLNALALIFATGFSAATAGHYWRRNRTIWIAGLLVGLNPVLVFWAANLTPCLLATACIAAALWKIMPWIRGPKLKDTLWVGVFLSFAAAFETVLLPFAICWPALALYYTNRYKVLHSILALAPTAIIGGLFAISSFQLQSPLDLNFDAFGMRVFNALSNYEAYDGKSFGLSRQLHTLLLINPIHWGLLFILVGGGLYARLKDGHRKISIYFCIGILVIFTISYAINEGASQARAAIIPLMAVFGSGAIQLRNIWIHAGKPTKRKIKIGGSLLALFVYSAQFGIIEHKSWESDYAFLASSNLQHGNNERATTWAEKAIELNPEREDLKEIIVCAEFNEWALSNQIRAIPIERAQDYLDNTIQAPQTVNIQTIRGIYHYKLRESDEANALWQTNADQCALAQLCLYWSDPLAKLSQSDIEKHKGLPYYDLLIEAIAVNRNGFRYEEIEAQLDNILAFAY